MKHLLLLLLCLSAYTASGQKMLLLERANRARTTKLYIGDELRFRMVGPENYWYKRTITDILPESNTLMLDNFAVKLDEIQSIKRHRKPIWRILGAAGYTLGATLTFATTVGRFGFQDKSVNAPKLYGIAAGSTAAGWFLTKYRKIRLGNKHRLRIVEIKFE
ncbi:MAG TPA: hypothetical protein VK168_18500 [Saprospiraceae bacterium]|nr:hypothetical protein [Saprospiraceae bacterium]